MENKIKNLEYLLDIMYKNKNSHVYSEEIVQEVYDKILSQNENARYIKLNVDHGLILSESTKRIHGNVCNVYYNKPLYDGYLLHGKCYADNEDLEMFIQTKYKDKAHSYKIKRDFLQNVFTNLDIDSFSVEPYESIRDKTGFKNHNERNNDPVYGEIRAFINNNKKRVIIKYIPNDNTILNSIVREDISLYSCEAKKKLDNGYFSRKFGKEF